MKSFRPNFNAKTISENWRFRFSDVMFANALHSVFDLAQVGTDITTDPWPLLEEGGWRSARMASDGLYALSNANRSTWMSTGDPLQGRYDNSTTSIAQTFTETAIPYSDLRFATWANVSFSYLGSVADSGDHLRLQVARGRGPLWTGWTDLRAETGETDVPNSAAWRLMRYNITASEGLGHEVRFRLNFTSNATGNNAPGFFIRDFAINAPSRYVGTIESAETDYLVGTLSFQDFDVRSGRAQLIRTPAGEILLYGNAYNSSAPPEDATRFRGFDFFENPQALFIVLLVTAYLTSWFQDRIFAGFRSRHPLKYRTSAGRISWLVWVARAFIILFVLFYFVPSFFVLFGAPNAFVTGPIFWAFSISSTVGLAVFTMLLYERQAKFIPPEESDGEALAAVGSFAEGEAPPPPPPEARDLSRQGVLSCSQCGREIEDLKTALKCRCGQVYHETCAADIGRCPNCQRAFDISRPAEKRMVTSKCPACGEIQIVPETADLMQTRCEACGALLREIERGYNYLVLAPENDLALEWFHSIVKKNVPGLAMSTTFQTLYFLADLYFVGRLGKEAVAGVSLAGNLMFIVLALTQSMSVGATSLISQSFGRKDRAQAQLVFNQAMVLSNLTGIVFGLLFFALRGGSRWQRPERRAACRTAAQARTLAAGMRVSRSWNSRGFSAPIVKQSSTSWASAYCRASSIRPRSRPSPRIFMPITPLPFSFIRRRTDTMVSGEPSITTPAGLRRARSTSTQSLSAAVFMAPRSWHETPWARMIPFCFASASTAMAPAFCCGQSALSMQCRSTMSR